MDPSIRINYGNYAHVGSTWQGVTYHGTHWRLCYPESNGCSISTRHSKHRLTKDHLYLLPPGMSFTTQQKNNPKQFYLHFDTEKPYNEVLTELYPIPLDSTVRTLLNNCLNEIQKPPHFLSSRGLLYAHSLIAVALAQIPDNCVNIESMDPRIREAIQHLRDKLQYGINVETLAERVGMSTGAFIRKFKQQTGHTPHAYLIESRIGWACELLSQSELSIDQIAEHVGFSDRFHFSKSFKQHAGVSPASYRNQGQK
ncbi:MAG: AraC family transcriptional regulator [Lentimonas sp.]